MLYNFIYPLHEWWGVLNILQYLTVRSGGAMMMAFVLVFLYGHSIIARLGAWQHGGDTVKDILPHAGKVGTPSMGGLMVVGAWLISCLFWADLTNLYVWLLVFLVGGFAALGFADDYCNLRRLWRRGLPGKLRLAVGGLVATFFVLGVIHLNKTPVATQVFLPFIKDLIVPLGIAGFVGFGILVIVGSANAVNLTDGLDGLVSLPVILVASTMSILAYVVARADFTAYLAIPRVVGSGEIGVMCAALAGAMLGFLWFNAPPARVFLGDSGSLPVGAFLGGVAVILKQEFALAIIGGLFVVEALSVMIQVVYFKTTGRRFFKMAPLHHHFEQLGWPESTIVVRFWIVSIILALIGLATLKLR